MIFKFFFGRYDIFRKKLGSLDFTEWSYDVNNADIHLVIIYLPDYFDDTLAVNSHGKLSQSQLSW